MGFSDKDSAREQALSLSREVIRHSATAIRFLHRQEYEPAAKLLREARTLLNQIDKALKKHQDLLYTGYVQDAKKEFAEGSLTLALVRGEDLPTPESLKVGFAPYLNGMGEAAGELRRYLLDAIRRDDFSRCEELLAAMDDIYGILVTMDFPDALTGGLRRTTDMVRGVVERTRGDLTMAVEQRSLGRRVEKLEGKLKRK